MKTINPVFQSMSSSYSSNRDHNYGGVESSKYGSLTFSSHVFVDQPIFDHPSALFPIPNHFSPRPSTSIVSDGLMFLQSCRRSEESYLPNWMKNDFPPRENNQFQNFSSSNANLLILVSSDRVYSC